MARYGKTSDLSADSVLEQAVHFFGPQGVGLELSEEDECGALFAGGGGFVALQVCGGQKGSEIELETREWDYQVLKFLRRL